MTDHQRARSWTEHALGGGEYIRWGHRPWIRCSYHDSEFARMSTASALETATVCRCVRVRCQAAPDGYHEHLLPIGGPTLYPAVITHHLHTWMPQWLQRFPGRGPVTVEDRISGASGDFPSLGTAFTALHLPPPPPAPWGLCLALAGTDQHPASA
jgi:hypothetical protein